MWPLTPPLGPWWQPSCDRRGVAGEKGRCLSARCVWGGGGCRGCIRPHRKGKDDHSWAHLVDNLSLGGRVDNLSWGGREILSKQQLMVDLSSQSSQWDLPCLSACLSVVYSISLWWKAKFWLYLCGWKERAWQQLWEVTLCPCIHHIPLISVPNEFCFQK